MVSDYYVVFTQGVSGIYPKILKRNFSHIYIITKDQFNWILLNPTRLYLQPVILPCSIDELPFNQVCKYDDTVLHVRFGKRDDTQLYGKFGMLNCVTLAKYMLGLRVNCLTPFSLYKRLLNLCPSEKETHAILSVKELHYDRSRYAVESGRH